MNRVAVESLHPILQATTAIDASLSSVAEVSAVFMGTDDKAAAMVELIRLESRLAELRLRVMAVADEVAEREGSHDVGCWLAARTQQRPGDMAADLRLARDLDRRRPLLAAALAAGHVTVSQARVITHALEDLVGDTDADTVARAEETLVRHAAEFDPSGLVRLGRRVLEVVSPEAAEAAEAKRLTRLPFPRRAAEAFAHLLESLNPTRLPVHGGDATTVVVTISLDALRSELATATIDSPLPGDALDTITAAQARRLACNAKIVPAVLGGHREVLDLGRSSRLFSRAQRRALLVRDRTCRARHCDIPGAWAPGPKHTT